VVRALPDPEAGRKSAALDAVAQCWPGLRSCQQMTRARSGKRRGIDPMRRTWTTLMPHRVLTVVQVFTPPERTRTWMTLCPVSGLKVIQVLARAPRIVGLGLITERTVVKFRQTRSFAQRHPDALFHPASRHQPRSDAARLRLPSGSPMRLASWPASAADSPRRVLSISVVPARSKRVPTRHRPPAPTTRAGIRRSKLRADADLAAPRVPVCLGPCGSPAACACRCCRAPLSVASSFTLCLHRVRSWAVFEPSSRCPSRHRRLT
jgi:hypothetical protein